MASYTDKTPKFNPYIQQLPVEAMVKVGMQKQAQYDDGLQKIQSSMENIAGLDVGRDVEKKYLESKLTDLGNNLVPLAGGDFSKAQLVNSITSMSTRLAKDPIINASVQSKANDKAEMALLEKDRADGTLTPHAKYYYDLKRQAYYGNENLTNEDGSPVSFSGKYQKSWDINKELYEAIKAVGDSKWSVENVFKIDPNTGQPLTDKNGMPVYSEFAIKDKREGKFNENIAAAINTVLLRPEAKQELAMQGVYNYKGYDKVEDFVEQYQKENEKALSNAQKLKLEINIKKAEQTDDKVRAKYDIALTKIDAQIEIYKKEDPRINDAKQFSSLDAYKAALQTRKVTNEYMTMGVTEQTSREYVRSTPHEVARDDVKAERDWLMQQDTSARGWASNAIAQGTLDLAKTKWNNDEENPLNKGLAGEFTQAPSPDGAYYGNLIEEANASEENMQIQQREFLVDYLEVVNNINKNTGATKESINNDINKWVKEDPDFVKKKYVQWKKAVENNATNPAYTNIASKIPILNEAEKRINRAGRTIKAMNTSPEVLAVGNVSTIDVDKLAKTLKSDKIEVYDNGQMIKIDVSPTDILNFQNFQLLNGSLNPSASDKKRLEVLEKQLRSKFYNDNIFTRVRKYAQEGDIKGRWAEGAEAALAQSSAIKKTAEALGSGKAMALIAAKEAYLKRIGLINAPLEMAAYTSGLKTEQKNDVDQKVKTILATFKDAEINVSNFSEVFKDEKSNSITYNLNRETGKIVMKIYDNNQKLQELPITKEQFNYIHGNVKVPEMVTQLQKDIYESPYKNSNTAGLSINDPNAYNSAYKPASYFQKQFNRSDIRGGEIALDFAKRPVVYIYVKKANGDIQAYPVKSKKGDIDPMIFGSVDDAETFLNDSRMSSKHIDDIIKFAN